ncbi:molybdopterin synthase subunit MoaD [Andreprevotia lacus DSM 23236]|jgi:molybdopterin converting factor subunit 1|uniref:Molybdopterin synthase sulfur carrier subunit n=1 Tax=Andreprevotia lacus DSM 23236 TaxID=1121001 RepID=A0A1W1XX45_9NEIS|nr:MoaD/ThiS family protein [Andreprevotia lacus]SMC28435.1 molybdopterin synthase subunit MoaD [Andreprevotia lacus DSM 23236]
MNAAGMQIHLLYFARLRDALACDAETITLPGSNHDVATLLAHLRQRGGIWASELSGDKPFRVAVDQHMATPATRIPDGAEVAVFPPVTGG